nr:MAG TPA: hypothetical protein [Caudoviricetes sp.]DAH86028.1 MAG TPA: hypothetical protein [Caudoviricetes sp.]
MVAICRWRNASVHNAETERYKLIFRKWLLL